MFLLGVSSRWWIITFRGQKSPKTPILGAWIGISSQICEKKSNSYIFRSVYQIDMKFDRQLRPATETSWVGAFGGKTVPSWRTAPPFWKSIYRHISAKNHPISMKFCYTQQQILNWVNVTWSKMKKLRWTDSEFDRTYFLLDLNFLQNLSLFSLKLYWSRNRNVMQGKCL